MKSSSLRLISARLLLLGSVFALVGGTAETFADDLIDNITGGAWNENANWQDGSAPVSGTDVDIVITGAATASNQNVAPSFDLENLSLLGNNNHTLSGNQLQFNTHTTGPTIVVNPLTSDRVLQIEASMDLGADLDISIFDGDLTLNNAISGSNGLNIDFQTTSSSYSVTLNGLAANTYTGTTTITGLTTSNRVDVTKGDNITAIAGDLVVDRARVRMFADEQIAASSQVTVKNFGDVELFHAQTLAGIAFDSGGDLLVNSASEALVLTGDVTASGSSNRLDGNAAGVVDLDGGNRTFDVDTGGTLQIDVALVNGDLTKVGDGLLNVTESDAFTGTITLTGGTLRAQANFVNDQNISAPAGTAVELNNGSYAGVVSGAGNFGAVGGGTLNLSAAQTYTGDTRINGTTLSLDASELLPNGTSLNIESGSLDLGAFDETVATLSLTGGSVVGSGALSAGTFDVQAGSVAAELTGAGNLTKTTSSDVTLSGSNSYTGTTTIDGGDLNLDGAERLPDTTDVTINNNAELYLNDTETVNNVIINAGNIRDNGGTPKLIASSFVVESGSAFVELAGGGGLTKNGTSSFNINVPATYAGNTTINQGTLTINSAGNLPASTTLSIDGFGNFRQTSGVNTTIDTLMLIDGSVTPNSGTGSATLTATTDFDVRKGVVSALLAGTATLTKTTADTVTLNATNTYTGATTISDGVLLLNTPDAVPGNVVNSGILRFQGSNGAFAGAVSGTGDVEVTGANVTFSGVSTHSGKTSVINSRTIDISASERLSDNTDLEIGNSSFSFGTLDLATFDDTVNSVTLFRGNINGTGTLNATAFDLQNGTVNATLAGGSFNKNTSNSVTINSASTFGDVTHESGTLSGSGSISGTSYDVRNGTTTLPLNGTGALTKTTTSLYQINSASSYSGATNVNDGELRVNSSGSLSATSAANVNGGTLRLQNNEQLPNAAPVDINSGGSLLTATETLGSLTLTDGSSSGGQLTATVANYDVRKGTISNSLAGTVGLDKTTADTVTLTGANSYSGGTTISAGVLEGSGPAVQGNVANNSVLRYVGSGTSPANISGPGSVEVNANVTLTGVNSYTGGTTVSSSVTGDTDSLQGNIVNNGNVSFNNSASGTYAGDISGSGSLQFVGSSEVLLTGNNTFAGTTFLGGAVALGSNTAIGPGNIQIAGATIRADGAARTVNNTFDVFGSTTFAGSEDLTFTESSLLSLGGGLMLTSTNTAKTTIDREINAAFGSTIHAAGGEFAIGNPNSFTGFKTLGDLVIDPGATLTLQSLGFIDLPGVTVMTNGTLGASNGFSLGASENILGTGTVAGDMAAQIGSIIAATTGDLTVGNAASFSGFFSDGLLITNENTVTINDKNNAVLGSLTKLGTGTQTGTLVAGAANPSDTFSHFLLEQGKDLTGRGNISGNFKNHGAVTGDGTGAGERIVFDAPWTVTGKGTFVNTTVLGTFSPGESPGVVDGENFLLGGDVIIELGGEAPGSGPDNHDQIVDEGLLALGSAAELTIASWNQFLPEIGDEFEVMTWADGIDGLFSGIAVDPWFSQNGIGFELDYRNADAAGSLIARAVETADFNIDGSVDDGDLAHWNANYGNGLHGGNFLSWQRQLVGQGRDLPQATAVPEPAAWQLALLVTAGYFSHSGRRRTASR